MFRKTAVLASLILVLSLVGAPPELRSQQAAQSNAATLRVIVPHLNTQLVIQGSATQTTGLSRVFMSPPLEPGKKYIYTLVGTWRPNNYTTITRTKQVEVTAGQE